jgi:hypothetical protein
MCLVTDGMTVYMCVYDAVYHVCGLGKALATMTAKGLHIRDIPRSYHRVMWLCICM